MMENYDWEEDEEDEGDEMTGTSEKVREPVSLVEGELQDSEVLDMLHKFNEEKNAGVAWAMVTQDADGSLSLHKRTSNPCFGEFRKYKKTHGDRATRGESRPGDLYTPFPDGTPVAVAFPFWQFRYSDHVPNDERYREILRLYFGEQSPYLRGFGSSDWVQVTKDDKNIYGVVISGTDFDSTVLINLMSNFRPLLAVESTYHTSISRFEFCQKAGMDDIEAVLALNSFYTMENISGKIISPNHGYYWCKDPDIQRMRDQNPHDLTGGSFRDGWDYNRKDLHQIFSGGSLDIKKMIKDGPSSSSDQYYSYYKDLQDFYDYARDVFRASEKKEERMAA